MNDRIKELWDKAATASAAYPSGQNSSWETHVNFMEKFAELIVKECALVANEHVEEAEGVHLGVGRRIKQHFGVKE